LIKQNNYFVPDLTNIEADDGLLNSFDIENIKLETILFQAGYLTIKEQYRLLESEIYKLKFPNREVYNSFYNAILNLFGDSSGKIKVRIGIYEALKN
jgi:hypothetical protein